MRRLRISAIVPAGKHDYLTSCILEGLMQLGCTLTVSDDYERYVGSTEDGFIRSAAEKADAILAFWSKKRDPGPKYHLLEAIGRADDTAYIDGSEYNCTGHKNIKAPWLHEDMLAGRAHYYFKRECRPADIPQGVKPLPFAVRRQDMKPPFYTAIRNNPETLDIFAAFGQVKTHPIRKDLTDYLQRMADRVPYRIVAGQCDPQQYREFTWATKLCVNAHGGGEDCMRFWEIMGANSVCVSQRFSIVMPDRYVPGFHYLDFDDMTEFKDKVQWAMNNPFYLAEMKERAFIHTRKHHTTQARARYLLKNMGFTDQGIDESIAAAAGEKK